MNYLKLDEIPGKTFVCGDIHGCYDDLMQLLVNAGFDTDNDRLICAGDLVDRGPDSQMCARLPEEPWFYTVMGNHEAMAIQYIEDQKEETKRWWIGNGGLWYFGDEKTNERIVKNNFFQLPLAIEMKVSGKTVVVIHADYGVENWDYLKKALSTNVGTDLIKDCLLWNRGRVDEDIQIRGCDLMIHGHTILDKPKLLGNRLFIDTGSFLAHEMPPQGHITLLCLDNELTK